VGECAGACLGACVRASFAAQAARHINTNDTVGRTQTATHCNTLQHTATHCNTLQHISAHCNTWKHIATHYNTLQHTETKCNALQQDDIEVLNTVKCTILMKNKCGLATCIDTGPQHTATHCNTLQHTATHCNTLQHTATHCNKLQHTATHCSRACRKATCIDTGPSHPKPSSLSLTHSLYLNSTLHSQGGKDS